MPLFTWDDSFSVEIERYDEQHKAIMDALNDLYDKVQGGATSQDLIEEFENIVDHSRKHFADEEQYFDQYHYELSQAHKNQYDSFVHKLGDVYALIKNGEEVFDEEFFHFAHEWLVHHIKESDKKYIEEFHAHGLY